MSFDKELLRLSLNFKFWDENKHRILDEFFSSNLKDLYRVLKRTHEKLKKDLTLNEIKALFYTENPTITIAKKEALENILSDIPGDISEDVAKEVIKKAWITEIGRRIAQAGIDIVNGKGNQIAVTKAAALLKEIEEGNIFQADSWEPISSDIEEILKEIEVTTKWQFNIKDLHTVAKGIGPGIFTIFFARPEYGKSAMGISLCASPGGFADQGAVCHYYCNEEPAQRIQGRAVMSYTGLPLMELQLNIEEAKEAYSKIKDRLKFFECKGKDISDIESHIGATKPDIAVFDQLDKLSIKGNFARNDERLGALYQTGREMGDKHKMAPIAISQANAQAEGKTYLSSVNLAEALTAKAAEADLCIGIGKGPHHTETNRVLNMVKNKITGNHTDVICNLQAEISRYVD